MRFGDQGPAETFEGEGERHVGDEQVVGFGQDVGVGWEEKTAVGPQAADNAGRAAK